MKDNAQKIYDSVLGLVAEQGWTDLTFRAATKKLGLRLADAKAVYPNGIDDVIDRFRTEADEAMKNKIKAKRHFSTLRVREKVSFCLRARLEALTPYKNETRRLLTRSALPMHLRESAQELWGLADAIWLAAGDSATDYNYYTKRVLLVGVMKTTVLFWLNDTSKDHQETWAFLDRRIDDVMKVGKAVSVVKTIGLSDAFAFIKSRLAA